LTISPAATTIILQMKGLQFTAIVICSLLILVSCGSPAPTLVSTPSEECAELQARGNGVAELVTDPVHHGTYSAKLAIPEHYNWGDAARLAVALDSVTLNDITSLSFRCYIDAETPTNPSDIYWEPYITFELDTDGVPGCDTWVIGGNPPAVCNSGAWFKNTLESNALFHVSSTKSDYTSPFPLSSMGTLAEIKAAIGPDGTTPLGDCIVSKVRLAIGNWGEGGPRGPVICYVDELTCNGRLLF
jgi:hypothetical protein